MDLLVIKCDAEYIRVKEEALFTVDLSKASVYPMEQLDRVRELLKQARNTGFPQAAIYRLTMTESPLEEAPCKSC